MTSFGRGRGWLSQNQNKDQTLRRPGEATVSSDSIVRNITDRIAAYDVRECISSELIDEIVALMNSAINQNKLKDVCNALWKQAILKDSLTRRTAVIFSSNVLRLQVQNSIQEGIQGSIQDGIQGGTDVRNSFLCFLQNNYMSKEKTRVEDSKTFANIVLLHAEVYYCMKLNNGNTLKVLAEPLIHYLEDILQDNPDDNIYFVMIQILRSGKDLYRSCPKQLSSLIMTIRQILLKENCDSQNRVILLLMIELANNHYEISDPQLKQFYLSNIKSLSFEHPFSQTELKVIVKTQTDEHDISTAQLPKIDDNQQITEKEMKNNISQQNNYSENPNVLSTAKPRAIRGSGALDKPKKGDSVNTKLRSLKITPKQKNNKGWDHDDRFHKDYE